MMYPSDEYIESCFKRRPLDELLFAKWCEGLPERAEDTPYHSGPHSIRQFRSALRLLQDRDISCVLETGFCLGHSASIFLGLGVEAVISIEKSRREQTVAAGEVMKKKYGDQFTLIFGSASERTGLPYAWLKERSFGFMFVDGGHEFAEVDADIKLGRALGIKHFLLDDFFPHWGPGVQPAMRENGLIPIAVLGTTVLAETSEGYTS